MDVGKGQRRHVGLPVALVGRRDGEPRHENHDEHPEDPGDRPPARAHEPESYQRAHRDENAEPGTEPRRPQPREVKVDGQGHPSEQGTAREPQQAAPYPPDRTRGHCPVVTFCFIGSGTMLSGRKIGWSDGQNGNVSG